MSEIVRQIQAALTTRGHKIAVDGDAGPATFAAIAQELGVPGAAPVIVAPFVLRDPKPFYDFIRPRLFGDGMTNLQVAGTNAILAGISNKPLADQAYMLATAYWEADKHQVPIREYGQGKGRKYGVKGRNGGQVAYGRGLVQTTWDVNYEKTDRELGLNGALIADYDLLLKPEIAVPAMVRGMSEGWYTGHRMSEYLPRSGPATVDQFKAARPIINGHDKDDEIAAIAMTFQAALQAGA